ncbi:MAG: helix-turn-helix domain-containing protein [Planctomycetaceae bacterium]
MATTETRPRTQKRGGKTYVLVPQAEYRRLMRAAVSRTSKPSAPKRNRRGNYPALETMRVLLSRDIIRDRQALGLTQAELADLAGVRVETVCRIETGKHTPTISTVKKIDAALQKAQRQR